MAHPRCETCGNDYDKAFQVVMDGESHTFDSFECAHRRRSPPTCGHCGLRIVGHGVEKDRAGSSAARTAPRRKAFPEIRDHAR